MGIITAIIELEFKQKRYNYWDYSFESSDTQPSCGRNSGSSLITIALVNPIRELSPALLLAE